MRKPLIATKPESKVSAFDYSCAKVLANAVSKHLRKTPNYKAWSNEFRLLRNIHAKTRIARVLDWYKDNAGKEYVPVAHSAKSFRAKFKAIESAMARNPTTTSTEPTDQARAIQKELALRWPDPQQKKDELQFIQTCLSNYGTILQNLRQVRDKDPRLVGLFLNNLRYSTPTSVAKNWLLSVHDFAWKLSKQNSKPLSINRYALSITSKRFNTAMTEYTLQYCADPERWTKLKEAMLNL